MKLKKVLSGILAGAVMFTSFSLLGENQIADAAVVDAIPNTNRFVKDYDKSFMSLTGYASVNGAVNDRSQYVGTAYYRTVKNEREFLDAVLDAQSGKVKVIEITNDLNLGWNELNLSSEEKKKYNFVSKYGNPSNGFTNPVIEASGVSKLNISNVNGITIFSTNGNTIKHVEFKLQSSANDVAIRNLKFDEMWQWDDVGNHKEVGWTFIKVNGANNVWIDHCTFTDAADGNVDIENGSSGLTFSWCEFGLEADKNPSQDSEIYQSINYMEQKYKNKELKEDSLYYRMREGGATMNEIMAYAAFHKKCHLVGSGDKDYMNYVDSNGKDYKDGNQRMRLTLAYCKYNNIGQRIPLLRQGAGHLFNCYVDDSGHMNILNEVSAIRDCNIGEVVQDNTARVMNARNGASIGADTCVFNGVEEPIVGAEIEGDYTQYMNEPWKTLFKDAYNNALIVNSKVTNSNGTYTGSSWDNNGDNLFTKGYIWHDKSTIGNWAWSSTINGLENMTKSNPPKTPFTYTYNYNEELPYTYNVVPLDEVESTIKDYSGSKKVSMSNVDWLKTQYNSNESNLKLDYDINSWNSGYKVSFKVSNNSDSDVSNWVVKVKKSDINISSSWCVNINEEGDYYVITPLSWNSKIAKGNSVEFGILGDGSINSTIEYEVK